MKIWFQNSNVEDIRERTRGTLVEHIGIEILEIGDDFIRARMPVDRRTVQPYGLLHGGASVTLAETLGSVASFLCLDPSKKRCVGLEINANHVRSVRSGFVYGIVTPVHTGRGTHLWDIRITDEQDRLVCVSRITLAILENELM
ncbi:MAG: hotdog fold thioesterase [Syntrophales bacterium]|jgi:1,4-dihydroxy-2-naphthoyl-CoA hydrolase|nr:hotdog fold thioesterase [Syntrophales bacterium]MDD5233356.1 hotdog fold thioesterase [Syntrophales bacterium]MDD5532901.1 hotdog fold thioesterase [Syntrophales bacterium]